MRREAGGILRKDVQVLDLSRAPKTTFLRAHSAMLSLKKDVRILNKLSLNN